MFSFRKLVRSLGRGWALDCPPYSGLYFLPVICFVEWRGDAERLKEFSGRERRGVFYTETYQPEKWKVADTNQTEYLLYYLP